MSPTPTRRLTQRHRIGACLLASALIFAACGAATPTGTPDQRVPVSLPSQPTTSVPAQPTESSQAVQIPPMADVPFARADSLGRLVQPGPGPTGTPALAWHADVGESHFLPVLAGGLVIVGSSDGYVLALDAHTGAARWKTTLTAQNHPTTPGGSGAVVDGLVFVADDSTAYALDLATGAKRWSTPVTSTNPRPRVDDGVVYIGTSDGMVGLDERTGAPVWHWRGPKGGASGFGPVADGVTYTAGADGRLYAIDIRSATTLWSHQTISDAVGTAEIIGDTIYVGTMQAAATDPVGALYALDRATGSERWMFQSPGHLQVTAGPVRDGTIYLGTAGDGLFEIRDRGTSYELVRHVDAPRTQFPLSLANDVLYEQRFDGSIGAYATDDLRLLWETDPADDNGSGPPIVTGGFVFAGHLQSGVDAFADPRLIAALALPRVAATSSAVPSLAPLANPFTVIRTFPWDTIGVVIPLGEAVGPDGLIYVLSTKPEVVVIDPLDGHVVRRWGSQGARLGQFDLRRFDDNPGFGDLDVARDGRVYVADGSNHRVQVFSPRGDFLFSIGTFGSGDGQFQTPAQITVGRDGRVYVLEEDGPISTFTADGKFVARIENREGARDLSVRPDGSIVATCEGCGQLLDLSPDDASVAGRHTVPLMDGDGTGPSSVDANGDVCIEFYASETILVIDRDGTVLGGVPRPPGARGTNIGRIPDYGDWYWPGPVFLPDGRAFTFNRDGLVLMSVSLTR
jgi:outer membrane protein assembly factor BamB